jgi:hypothetical protein
VVTNTRGPENPDLRSTADGMGLISLSAIVQHNINEASERIDRQTKLGKSYSAPWLVDREAERTWESAKRTMERLGLWIKQPEDEG